MRLSSGEIDLVASQGGELVFLEVKTRRPSEFALPEDAISSERMDHLEAAIDEYFDQVGLEKGAPYRVEVVAIEVDRSGRVCRFEVVSDIGLR